MRNNAQDANLPGRIDDRGNRSLSAASATAAGTPVRRTRLNLHGRRFGAGRTLRRQRNG
jgi:hypothetical protein